MLKVALMAATLAMAGCGEPSDGPAAFVKTLYAPYIADKVENAGLQNPDNVTAGLRAEIAKAEAYGRLLEEPVIDYDPVINAQDFEIKAVTTRVVTPAKDGVAAVEASFTNMATPTKVTFNLREEDGVWKIDDIQSDGVSFRASIGEAIKPAGDVAAMEAPVRAIYAAYANGATPEPLHRWAAFSKDLRPLMERQSAMGRRADTPVLDFDPALAGKTNHLSAVAFETASHAVIARFQNGTESKIVVYDLVEEDGGWKIANIRAPGDWDLLNKLRDAGVITP